MTSCVLLLALMAGAAPPPRSPLVAGVVLRGVGRETIFTYAISPDGKHVATGCLDEKGVPGQRVTLRRWRADDGRAFPAVKTKPGAGLGVLSYSPDGKWLAGTTFDGLYVWDATSMAVGEIVAPQNDKRSTHVLLSPSGKVVDWLHLEKPFRYGFTLLEWGEKRLARIDATGTTFNQQSRLFAVPDGQDVDLFDPTKDKVIRTLADHRGWVRATAFSPDGKRLAVASSWLTRERRYFAEVRLWDATSGKLLRTLSLGECHPRDLAFSGDGRWLVVAGRVGAEGPGRLLLFDGDGALKAERAFVNKETLVALSFAAKAPRFATAHADGSVRVWDVRG